MFKFSLPHTVMQSLCWRGFYEFGKGKANPSFKLNILPKCFKTMVFELYDLHNIINIIKYSTIKCLNL